MNLIVSVIILFNLWPNIIQVGIMADDNLKVHYRQIGAAVCFTVAVSPSQLNGTTSWKYKSVVVAESRRGVNPTYKMRADYSFTDHTLCIRELDPTDQGDYVAISENWTTEQTAKHRLILENAVPAPVIKISRLSSAGPPGSCNVVVNCTVEDDWASIICDEQYCTGSQLWSSTKVNITIYNNKGTILCAGNNHVSTKTKSASTKEFCFSENDSNHVAYTVPLAICAGVIIGLCILIWGIRKYRLSMENTPQPVNTVYEEVEQSQRCQVDRTAKSTQVTKNSKASLPAQSVYSMLQLPAGVSPSDNNNERHLSV